MNKQEMLDKLDNEFEEILKRNKVKSYLKLCDKKKSGDKDLIRAYALSRAYGTIENDQTVEYFLSRPSTQIWICAGGHQKSCIDETLRIFSELKYGGM